MKRCVGAHIDSDLRDILHEYCANTGIRKGFFIEKAIKTALEAEGVVVTEGIITVGEIEQKEE